MMKLTKPMMDALRKLNAGSKFPGNFKTLESLRRRGLAERYTTFVIRAEYVNKDGANCQYQTSARKPVLVHEWWHTSAGIEAEQ